MPEVKVLPQSAIELKITDLNDGGHFEMIAYMRSEVRWPMIAGSNADLLRQYTENAFEVLWYHVEKYYLHAKAVISHSKHYKTGTIARALDRTADFQKWIMYNRYDIDGLVNNTINMKDFLKQLLPAEQNSSYTNSVQKFEMIINTAVAIKKQLQQLRNTG